MHDFDLFVIGGGSGGVRCARIAAGYGARVGIADERYWGGTCVNVGCVPKKLLVQAGEYGAAAVDSRAFGWDTTVGAHDWRALIAAKDDEISRLNAIYVSLLDRAGVTHFDARATFVDPHTLDLGLRRVTAARIVIATGGHPIVEPRVEGAELGIVSDAAFRLHQRPARIVIVGAGYIGVEFAGIFNHFGSDVTLVYRQAKPLRGFDEDMRDDLADAIDARGIAQRPLTTLHRITRDAGHLTAELSDGTSVETDLVFFALGRKPHTEGLGLDRAGVQTTQAGGVVVDDESQTSVAHIYAIGDVCNRLNLTPVAIAEGHRLAHRLFGPGEPRRWQLDSVAKAVFFSPPLASVGLTEQEASQKGCTEIYLSRFTPLRHTISARAANKSTIKLVVDQASNVVLGAHMLGDDAPEIIQGFAVAVGAGLTKRDIDQTVGIHPTSAEELVTMRDPARIVGLARAAEVRPRPERPL